ncbi:hypothetical protein F4809DRAFT_532292 [Biscogniauxia mediterranea]|nr:hypothetical protein F4809DRAFT_532292 [Biscogniauxia mediterranea]
MDQDNTNRGEPKDIKGKGKEKSNENEDIPATSEPGSETDSLLSRLATSTTRLTSGLITHQPDSNYINAVLTSSKPGTSGTSTSQRAGTSAKEISYNGNATTWPTHEHTFKSVHAQQHVNQEEASFSRFYHPSGLDQTEPQRVETTSAEQNLWQSGPSQQVSHGALYSMSDGAEVVRLLDSDYEGAIEEADIPMTSDERLALRQALFTEDGNMGKAWEDVLGFLPEFFSDNDSSAAYARLSGHLGVSDPELAREIWITQWKDVLSSYTDEVWGDLSGLVGRAREELQTLAAPQGQDRPTGLQALRRLQQILAHVRGS